MYYKTKTYIKRESIKLHSQNQRKQASFNRTHLLNPLSIPQHMAIHIKSTSRPFELYAVTARCSRSSSETVITQSTKRSGSNRLFAGIMYVSAPPASRPGLDSGWSFCIHSNTMAGLRFEILLVGYRRSSTTDVGTTVLLFFLCIFYFSSSVNIPVENYEEGTDKERRFRSKYKQWRAF